MKKIFSLILTLLSLILFQSDLKSQCNTVTVDVIPVDPQSGPYNYFGVKVTLPETYSENVTVSGYIYDEGDPNTNHPFELTVYSGYLTAETSATFYQTCPTCNAVVDVSNVSPCPTFLTTEIILSGLNFSYIQNLINTEDSTGLCEYFEPVASDISQYILLKYGEDIIEDYDTTLPLPTMVLSLLLFSKENSFFIEDSVLVDPLARIDPANCFFNILGDLVGYTVIVQLYNDFVNGATATTIWRALKQLVRRVFAGIAIALAIYHLGDCLDWW